MEYHCTDDFNVFCLDGDKVHSSIKEEQVSVIQGHRCRRRLRACGGGGDWNEELGFRGTAPRSVQPSRVTKMKCSAHQVLFTDHTSSFEMGSRSARMLTMFCWRLNIPHLFGLDGRSETRSRTTGESSSSTKKNKSSQEKSNTGNPGSTPSNPVSSEPRRRKRGMGGAGKGGKPPPKRPRRDSLSDSDISLPTEEETTSLESSDTSETLTLTESSYTPKAENPGKRRNPGESRSHWEREAITKLALAETKMLADSPAQRQVATLGGLFADEGNEDEWLRWTSSEDQNVDEDQSEEQVDDPSSKDEGHKAERHVQQFVDSMKLLYRVSSTLGLTPYARRIDENGRVQVQCNYRSSRYCVFYFNAVFFLLVTLGTLSTLLVVVGLSEEDTISASEEILQLDYANHIGECLFLTFITMFLSIWAVSCIMELGPHYSEFMTRFNLGIYLIKYDVGEGIHSMVKRTLLTTAVFLSAIVALFFGGRTNTAAVREACGFVGMSVLRPFNSNLRESAYFPLVEIFGLCVFLHNFLSFIVVLLEFVIYAKALENMAERFNLRLVYRLGMVAKRTVDGSVVVMKKYIPYSKLEAEHRVIMSLFHHLGRVSGVVYGGYLFTIGLEVMLVMWMVLHAFSAPEVSQSSRYVKKVGSVELAVPLRVGENYSEILFEVGFILVFTFVGFLTFGGVMHKAAEILQTGNEFVRRFGFLRCRCKKDVRFLLTMINSYTNKYPFWIGKVFHWNRMVMIAFLGLIAASMVFASFHPSRSGVVHFLDCNEQGTCTVFNIRRGELRVLYSSRKVSVPLETSVVWQSTHRPRTPERQEGPRLIHVDLSFRLELPCTTPSVYPYAMDVHASAACESRWPRQATFPPAIYTPLLYKPIVEQDQRGASKPYFASVVQQFANVPPRSSECSALSSTLEGASAIHRLKVSSCISSEFPCFFFPFTGTFNKTPTADVFDCFGGTIRDAERDDCDNLKLVTPNNAGEKIESRIRLVDTSDLPGVQSEPSLLCCYEYRGYPESEKQVQVCNMPDVTTLDMVCRFGKDRPRIVGSVKEVHDKLLAVVKYEKDKGAKSDFLSKNHDVFAKCLCQFGRPPSGDGKRAVEQCESRLVLPCRPGFPANVKDYALQCESISPTGGVLVYIPILYKANATLSIRDPVEHKRYRNYCKGARFSDSLNHDNNLAYPNPTGGNTELEDCGTRTITLGERDKDDCQNWRIFTPDSGGNMISPQVRLLQYNLLKGSIAKDETGRWIFLCCFHYASPAFQGNSKQLTFCNTPSLNAMNSPSFCGRTTKRGMSAPPLPSVFSSPPRLHEQLNEKLQRVTKLFKTLNDGELLDDLERHDKWRNCLCPNLIQPFGQSDYDKSVEECIAMIPTPCELAASGFDDAYSNCETTWANFPIKGFQTRRIFTKVNGIWEAVAPYRKDKKEEFGECLNDAYPEHAFGSQGYTVPPLFDCFGQPFKLVQDECRNLALPEEDGVPPKVHPSPEFLLGKYDSSFVNSDRVRCCYSYPKQISEKWRVCNKPSGKFLRKDCETDSHSDRRKRHEKELVRRLLVESNGAEFVGNKVVLALTPSTLEWNSPQEESWTRCICEDRTTPEGSHSKCQGNYLLPCIKPKNTPNDYLDARIMLTECATSWPSNDNITIPKYITFPLVMQLNPNDNSFKVVKRFSGKECPFDNEKNQDILLSPGGATYTDCYGESISTPVKKDNCGNPWIGSPDSSGGRKFPEVRLIPVYVIPGFDNNSQSFFCCYEYPSNTDAVNVCNKPNKKAFERQCSTGEKSPEQIMFTGYLKAGRARSDVFAENVSDPHRILWTMCICEGTCPDEIKEEVKETDSG